MHLQRLYVSGFRNLREQEFYPSPGLNLIIGDNGQGKTNILEAIYLLSLTKSFRTPNKSDFIKWGESRASIFGEISSKGAIKTLGVLFEGDKKVLELNGDKITALSRYIGNFITVTFSPLDLGIVRGSGSTRRRFLDKHIVDRNHNRLEALLSYQRALTHKQKLLKSLTPSSSELSPWNKLIAREGASIARERREFCGALLIKAKAIHQGLAPEDPPLGLSIASSIKDPETRENEELFFEFLEQSSKKEILARSALYGPHRDDLTILLGASEAKPFASQGQARTIVIALKLGILSLIEEKKDGDSPVVLLDDVESELDMGRREKLLELVSGQKGRQVIITGTDRSTLKAASQFTVQEGVISR